ncbi:thioredoxin reductase [Pseudomonas sp. PA15(2017)]|nr:thioredoxin reductase [Pseudomonas sp. PA15(2017)]
MESSADLVIVGAGAAGIGMGLMLQALGVDRFVILDRGDIGESFRRWPAETSFITPSFYSNPFGLPDLNAVSPSSSPAITSRTEHLNGQAYADYLALLASKHELPVITQCSVEGVQRLPGDGFELTTSQGSGTTKLLIWATGEFQFPDLLPFPGAQLCRHYAQVRSWKESACSDQIVIGGYESGIDAAINLIRMGCRVKLLVRKPNWDQPTPEDPSLSLSPFSRERMDKAMRSGRLELHFGADVTDVSKMMEWHRVRSSDGRVWLSENAPILGTGFLSGGGARQIEECFDWAENGKPILTEHDESSKTPGLFMLGPQVQHEQRIYCFIYKFRQRFPVVALKVLNRLGLPVPDNLDKTWALFDPPAEGCCSDECDC